MLKANAELRERLRNAGIPLWMVAKEIGVDEKTLVGWLRYELSDRPERQRRVISAVELLMG